MHTLWVRLNAVVFFGLTVIVCLAVLTWFSTATHRGFPTVETLKMNKLTSLRSHGNKDIAVLTFDLHADLEKAFNWNVKQLFVFVVAEYRSKKHPLNQVVVWDTIINDEAARRGPRRASCAPSRPLARCRRPAAHARRPMTHAAAARRRLRGSVPIRSSTSIR